MYKKSYYLFFQIPKNYKREIFKLFLFIFFFSAKVSAQDYPLAPEVWSEPILIDSVSTRGSWDEAPSLTKNLDTMYFGGGDGIYMSLKYNEQWHKRIKLDSNVNDGTPIRYPSLSKDGKRLYSTAYAGYGSWDIWYNDWNDDSLRWSKPKNMGPVINSPYTDYYLFEVSPDTVYIVTSRWFVDAPALFIWDTITSDWCVADSFSYHQIGAGRFSGLSITKNYKKMYFSRFSYMWPNYKERGTELCVCYWDTTINNWGNPYFLNINSKGYQPDTTNDYWLGGYDSYPYISQDGKTLFFASNRDAAIEDSVNMTDIYISRLLVDENGDTVSYIVKPKTSLPLEIILHQNYPNPFNSPTIISYSVKNNSYLSKHININLYDILGRKIVTLFRGKQKSGDYKISFDGAKYNLSSGLYLINLQSEHLTKNIKILYLK